MNIIILFTILTIVNVIFSTIKSIVTIKSGRGLRLSYLHYTTDIITLSLSIPLRTSHFGRK